VQIVAAYIIWIHHEQNEGVWTGAASATCAASPSSCRKHGMYLYPRIGRGACRDAQRRIAGTGC